MAFPASQSIPAVQLVRAQTTATRIKTRLQQVNTASAAGPIERHLLVAVMGQLTVAIAELNDVAATPGIAQFAKDQFNNQAFDIVGEFNAMVSAVTALRDWVFDNFPKDAGTGAWLLQSFDNAGTATELTFTTAQLAQYRTNADAVIATIG